MNPDDLTEILERSAGDVPVGPPPLGQMHRTARRRRSVGAGLAAAAAVAIVVGGAVLWPGGDGPSRDPSPTASDSPSTAPVEAPPAGFRWVGRGQAVIAVPDSWGTNLLECGTPTQDTVLIDVGATNLCYVPYPASTTSVAITSRREGDRFGGWVPIEVDGEKALRSPDETNEAAGAPTLHRSAVYLPERDVLFEVSSTVSRQAVGEALDRITLLDSLVAVPGFADTNEGADLSKGGERYVRALLDAGLRAEVVTEPAPQSGLAGYVVSASPEPGSVVEPGSTVTVTVAD